MTNVISVHDLQFSYHDHHAALRGVSFDLCEGDKVALVGPNGAGKSTLMLHLNGILTGKGEVTVGGARISRDNLPAIRAMVGLVFQNPDDQLFERTVIKEAMFGPRNLGRSDAEAKAAALEALATGETTKKAAKRFRVTPGRISQLRRELQQNWQDFQGEFAFA